MDPNYFKTVFFELVYTEHIENEITELFLPNVLIIEHDKVNKIIRCALDEDISNVNIYIKYYYRKNNTVPYFKMDFYNFDMSEQSDTIYCFVVIDNNNFATFYVVNKYKNNMYKSCSILANFLKDCEYNDTPCPYSQ